MSKKQDAKQIFEAFFDGKLRLLKYFGAEKTDHYDYDFSIEDDIWDFVGGCACSAADCVPDKVIWGPGEDHNGPIPLTQDDCGYSSQITSTGVFETEHYTLVFTDPRMGGSMSAMIFDNAKRYQRPI